MHVCMHARRSLRKQASMYPCMHIETERRKEGEPDTEATHLQWSEDSAMLRDMPIIISSGRGFG